MTGMPISTSPLRLCPRTPELAAIEALLDRLADDPGRTEALLGRVPGPPSSDSDVRRGRAALARGLLDLRGGPVGDARELLLLAARLLAPHDRRLALEAVHAATEAA
ncbi:hypothetical protein [Streptomyces sp. RKND-216]|uniref:hypothetical protein n=1 Tax=Streptomyces sp. RKND-216 TaxID=2562581 RepID=UPI001FFAB455|nr:hypothetical protein [Streptomyces sp. RKND-216]